MARRVAPEPKRRSWNRKVPTTGGPVAYLNIYAGQEDIPIPAELRMGDQGTYLYLWTEDTYRWIAND
jgi:hypothetical protein